VLAAAGSRKKVQPSGNVAGSRRYGRCRGRRQWFTLQRKRVAAPHRAKCVNRQYLVETASAQPGMRVQVPRYASGNVASHGTAVAGKPGVTGTHMGQPTSSVIAVSGQEEGRKPKAYARVKVEYARRACRQRQAPPHAAGSPRPVSRPPATPTVRCTRRYVRNPPRATWRGAKTVEETPYR